MRVIPADYNATTEAGHLRLGFGDSRAALRAAGKQVGDHVWLSDGEVLVGATLARDDAGLVGIPDWETIVHLDDDEARDVNRVWTELQTLLSRPTRSAGDEARAFELLTQFDHFGPSDFRALNRAALASGRATALLSMGKPELALVEILEARATGPVNPSADCLYLALVRQTAPERAVREALALVHEAGISADVLAVAINILAERAENFPDDQFAPAARETLELCDRFERAPGRPNVAASLLSLVHFNRGMILLKLGRQDEARRALELAHAIEPSDETLDEATRLDIHDEHARKKLAERVRSRPSAA
jgi:tetratricopeptide (TPR) repeat protein